MSSVFVEQLEAMYCTLRTEHSVEFYGTGLGEPVFLNAVFIVVVHNTRSDQENPQR